MIAVSCVAFMRTVHSCLTPERNVTFTVSIAEGVCKGIKAERTISETLY